jgi:hypothetical protein
MDTQVLASWQVTTLEELTKALAEATDDARHLGHSPDTIYPNKLCVLLVQEALSDGSHVLNLEFHDGERAASNVVADPVHEEIVAARIKLLLGKPSFGNLA